MAKKVKCEYCNEVNTVERSDADEDTINHMWEGNPHPVRCKNCGTLDY